MIQEVNPSRGIMAIDLAEPLLGGLYTLFVDALGSSAAWWIGHITLIASSCIVYWVITNWKEISYGFELTGTRFVAYLVLIGMTVAQVMVYQNTSNSLLQALPLLLVQPVLTSGGSGIKWNHKRSEPNAFMSRERRHPMDGHLRRPPPLPDSLESYSRTKLYLPFF